MAHYHSHSYLCKKCLSESRIRQMVDGLKDDCRAEGFYCVDYVIVLKCHKCSAIRVPVGTWLPKL